MELSKEVISKKSCDLKQIHFNQLSNLSKLVTTAKANVFKAEWNNKTIALKTFPKIDNKHDFFQNELDVIQKLSTIKNDYILRYYGHGDHIKYGKFIVMEFAESKAYNDYSSLYETSFVQRLSFCRDLFDGLACLHNNKIIHRDIKQDNLFVFGSKIKLADFDTARIKDEKIYQADDYLFCGVTEYTAPEVLSVMIMVANKEISQFKCPYNEATDVYNAGITAYEIMSDRVYDRNTEDRLDFAGKVINGKRPIACDEKEKVFNKGVDQLLKKCWQDRQDKRPVADDVRKDFEQELLRSSSPFYDFSM